MYTRVVPRATGGLQPEVDTMGELGGTVSVVLVIWYVLWRVGFVRELMRRAGISHHQTKS